MSKIFVFGSNLAGRHGAGAAKHARLYFGAVPHVGSGLTGNAYAIPTKDWTLHVLPLDVIRRHVASFIAYATTHSHLTFYVTAIGTGLAGYSHAEIAPMFKGAPSNCELPEEWQCLIGKETQAKFTVSSKSARSSAPSSSTAKSAG